MSGIPEGSKTCSSPKCQAEKQFLRESVERYRQLVDNTNSILLRMDPLGNVTFLNTYAQRFFGFSEAEILGKNVVGTIVPPEETGGRNLRSVMLDLARNPERYEDHINENLRKDGQRVWVHWTNRPMFDSRGEITEMLCVGNDISLLREAEKEIERLNASLEQRVAERTKTLQADNLRLQASEAQQRQQAALLDRAGEAILMTDLERRVVYWNRSAEELYGWSAAEAVGQPLETLIYPAGTLGMQQAWDGVVRDGEWMQEIPQKSKSKRMLLVSSRWRLVRNEAGRPQSILMVNTDLTEQKQLEAKFLQAQRLESLGTLASGIAHDLNNILAPIVMAIDFLHEKLADDESKEMLASLENSAQRGTQIVQQIIMFARGMQGDRMPLSPGHLIEEMAKFAQATFPANIRVQTNVPENLWMIAGDAAQMHQVLLNLCINARDAMPEGGQLTLSAENLYLDENFIQMNPEAQPGAHVIITISDTGRGISHDVLDKVFDPFFTTKEVGKGTGLGLSTALGIVKSHNGFIHVYSEPQVGTQFRVYLPATEADPLQQMQSNQMTTAPRGRNQLILVVDAEASVRHIMQVTLENNGYRVITAADGTEGVEMYAQRSSEVDLVLTDMTMPDLLGSVTIRALQRINPLVLIVASSGIPSHKEEAAALGPNVKAFLQKPFAPEKLLATLGEVLEKYPAARVK